MWTIGNGLFVINYNFKLLLNTFYIANHASCLLKIQLNLSVAVNNIIVACRYT